MNIERAVKCIVASVIVCGVLGIAIGVLLGVAAPGYYEAVFANGTHPDFDSVAVGFGLGLTQGVIVGAGIGCAIVLAVAWYESRTKPSV